MPTTRCGRAVWSGTRRSSSASSLREPYPEERASLLARVSKDHHVRLNVPFRLFALSPAGVSLTEPVTLTGPPNIFCSALSVRSHFSSALEMSAPSDTVVSVGRMLNRTAWLLAQLCDGGCPALGSVRVTDTPFCSVSATSSLTGTERLSVVPSLPCSCDGSRRVSIAALSQLSAVSSPGAVTFAQATPLD